MGTADHLRLTLLRLFHLFLITQAVQLAIGGETLGETWLDSLRAKLKEHFHSFWNILDAFIILFIIATVIIRACAALDTSDDQTPASNNATTAIPTEPDPAHYTVYVKLAYVFLFSLFSVRILHIYTASPFLGPKLEMIKR